MQTVDIDLVRASLRADYPHDVALVAEHIAQEMERLLADCPPLWSISWRIVGSDTHWYRVEWTARYDRRTANHPIVLTTLSASYLRDCLKPLARVVSDLESA